MVESSARMYDSPSDTPAGPGDRLFPPETGPAPFPRARPIAFAGLGLALALAVQALGLPNLVTGVVVNALFITISSLAGPWAAGVVGVLTPFGAMITGHLHPHLLPLAPFIAAGNVLYIQGHVWSATRALPLRVVVGPGMKSAIIGAGGWILLQAFAWSAALRGALLAIVTMQMVTACGGVVLGEGILARIAPGGPASASCDVARR